VFEQDQSWDSSFETKHPINNKAATLHGVEDDETITRKKTNFESGRVEADIGTTKDQLSE